MRLTAPVLADTVAPPMQHDDANHAPAAPDIFAGRLREVAGVFLRLGFTAFGGPAAHVALMEDEVVTRRRWIDRTRFLDLVALLNFIPGPNSTELAIQLGFLRAGFRGLVVGGVCFIAPAVMIILPLAWAYERYGSLPRVNDALAGINAGVLAVVGIAGWRFARTSITGWLTAAVAIVAAGAAFAARAFHLPQSDLYILAGAAVVGAAPFWIRRGTTLLLAPLSLVDATPLPATPDGFPPHWLLSLFLCFLRVGTTLFGSGYVLVSYLQAELVDGRGWLSERELLDAIAMGQVTPGPLLTAATFVGYVIGRRATGSEAAGVVGGLAATVAIFLPAFFLVALLGRWLPRLREWPAACGALDATNAAVAALVFVVTITLAHQTLRDPISIVVALVAVTALLALKLNATWVILAAAAAGLIRST